MIVKPFKDWENIFLDTSIVIHIILSARPGITDKQVLFTKKLIEYLSKNKAASGKERRFYVSALTIAEIWSKSNDKMTKEIVKAIDSENTTIVAFDNEIADLMTNSYNDILGSKKLNKFASELSFPSSDLLMAREWIQKDTMIIGSSQYLNCDILMTLDGKTMYRTAQRLKVPCVYAMEKYFDQSEQFFLGYKHEVALKENPY